MNLKIFYFLLNFHQPFFFEGGLILTDSFISVLISFLYPISSSDDDDEGMVGSSKVDYERTLTDSYKNLNNMIGGEGMQRMTKDTERLMATQKELAKNMENMKPMLENAQNMIKGMGSLDIKGLGKMMNQLGGMGAMRGNKA